MALQDLYTAAGEALTGTPWDVYPPAGTGAVSAREKEEEVGSAEKPETGKLILLPAADAGQGTNGSKQR